MRLPKVTMDEVLLLVDAYFRINDPRKIRLDNEIVIELSNIMRSLPIHNDFINEETFRNLNGMRLKLYEIASIDEETKISLKSSSLQRDVYNYYKNNPKLLHKVTNALKACLPLPIEYNKVDEDNTVFIGNILLQYHKYIENKSEISQLVKNESIKRQRSICYICDNNLFEIYGEKAYSMLEVHYGEEIYELKRNMPLVSSRFLIICPNCHRLAHSHINLFEETKLKDFVKPRGAAYV